MEEGSLRCDANVSVRLRGAEKFGTKVEVKNLNSFRYLQHALEYEIERQIGVLESGETDGARDAAVERGGGPHGIRCVRRNSRTIIAIFPSRIYCPCALQKTGKEKFSVPCRNCRMRSGTIYDGIRITSTYDAGVLTATAPVANYFEATVQAGTGTKIAANWIQTELLRRLNDSGKDISHSPVSPEALAELLKRIEKDEITGAIGKNVFAKMFETGKPAAEIIASEGLSPINDAESVEKICRTVLAKNPDNVAKYRAGNEGVFKFFVGQVMRETRGRANPQTINDILKRLLQQS